MKPKQKKFAYIQDWGTYGNDTIVAIGMTIPEIVAFLKRKKQGTEEQYKELLDNEENLIGKMKRTQGFCAVNEDGTSIIWFPDWEDDWHHYEVLLHEICHAVHNILGKYRNMMDEDESRAYQTEYLFHNIRRTLFERVILKRKAKKVKKVKAKKKK